MYYGYNNKKQLIMADEAFIELLGYSTFNQIIEKNIINSIEFKNNKISIQHKNQDIVADFIQHEVFGTMGDFYLLELKNISIQKIVQKAKKSSNFKTNYQAIYLNVNKISEDIGLSVEDYKLYLDSFIDQSIIDERRLLEGDDKVIKNLSNLALTLKIPHINILLLKIKKLSNRERMPLIDEYYTKLALLTLEEPEEYQEDDLSTLLETDNYEDEKKEELLNARFTDLLNNISKEKQNTIEQTDKLTEEKFLNKNEPVEEATLPPKKEELPVEEAINVVDDNKKNKINLDTVTPLPISYNPQTAADELNLPVVLIEEFVDDFIEQARHDKEHLLTSHYQKDMDNIHELGHKLKGAASNLRINELADILEEIQFCTNHEKLEPLFIKYWGHFLSLEDYMKQLKAT